MSMMSMQRNITGRKLALMLLMCLLLAGQWGCGSKDPYFQKFRGDPSGKTCSIGVLPFMNQSSYSQGGDIAYRSFQSELVRHQKWQMALEGDVRRVYRQLHLRSWEEVPTPEQLRIIANRLGVELLIGGEVLEMEEKLGPDFVDPALKVRLRVHDGASGELLWATVHAKKGSDYRKVLHFGLINTVTALSKNVFQEILEIWESKGFVPCAG